MYIPFSTADETNNDRGRDFFIHVARWKSNKSIKKRCLCRSRWEYRFPSFRIFPYIGKEIYTQAYIKIDGRICTNILQTDRLTYNAGVTQETKSEIRKSEQNPSYIIHRTNIKYRTKIIV